MVRGNKLYRRQIRETERSVQLKKLEVEAKFGELKLQINNHLPKLVKIHDHYREVKLIFRNFGKEEIPVRLDERDMSDLSIETLPEKHSGFIDFSDLKVEEISQIADKIYHIQSSLDSLILNWQIILGINEKEIAFQNKIKLVEIINRFGGLYKQFDYEFDDLIKTLYAIHYDKEGYCIKKNSKEFNKIEWSIREKERQVLEIFGKVELALKELVLKMTT